MKACCSSWLSRRRRSTFRPVRAAWVALVLLAAGSQVSADLVYETRDEWQTRADLDGDGRQDLVIVDRGTGDYRLGYQLSDGIYTWAPTRASGVEGVTAVASGHLLSTTRDALALTSPEANRVNLFEASNPSVAGTPRSYFSPAVGTRLLAAVDIGGAGNTAHDDLWLTTSLNNAPNPAQLTLARNDGVNLSTLAQGPLAQEFLRAQPVQLKAAGLMLVGATVRDGAADRFLAYRLDSGSPVQVLSETGLPGRSKWVYHRFGATTLHQFLFYTAGQSNLVLAPVLEPVPGTFQFGSLKTFPLGHAIDLVAVLPGISGARLLVLQADGAGASVYKFDGVNSPTLVASFAPTAGESFTGALALGNEGVVLLSGASGQGRSSHFQEQLASGGGYAPGASGALPKVSAYSAPANVFVFQAEPFVNSSPKLIQRLSAGDWTSKPSLSGAPLQIKVTAETYAGVDAGLDNPVVQSLGLVTSPGAFGLVNQYTDGLSIFSYVPPLGDEVVEVLVSPPPGAQAKAINVTLTASPAAAQIFYRVDGDAKWQLYAQPVPLFKAATLRCYAKLPASDRKSAIQSATYTFPAEPSTQDSDNDGVPDYVELGLDANSNGTPDYLELGDGLNPVTGNKDSDGDGFSDLNELAVGTNPYDKTSTPSEAQRVEDNSGFDLAVSPVPYDGFVPGPTRTAPGAAVRVYDLEASLLRAGMTTNLSLPSVPDAASFNTNLVVDARQRLLVLATEAHFPVVTAQTDKKIGRELLALMPVPDVSVGLPVSYTYAGGDLATEAAAWAAAAQVAQAAATRVRVLAEPTWSDTLTALLMEWEVESLLKSRGLGASNVVSLFGFRPADAGRYVPSTTELNALEQEPDAAHPAYSLTGAYAAIAAAVATPPTAAAARLKSVAEQVYRVSSVSNNAAPGMYPLPADVLREFIRGGVLHSNYLAGVSLTGAELTEAAGAVSELLALVQPRPKATLTLTVMAESFSADCTLLDAGGTLKSLVYANGNAYLFPQSFVLIPGTQVKVVGYTDLPPSPCGGDTVEVIRVELLTLPAVATVDTDGDLLPDGYECALLGGLGANPFDDADGDGFSNLQELLDGTDPMDKLANSGVPVSLLPPEIQLAMGGGGLGLQWHFPAAYIGKFQFGLLSSESVVGGFSELPVTPAPLGGDAFQVLLPEPAGATRFYLLYLKLK